VIRRNCMSMEKTDKSDQFISVVESNKGIIYKVANTYCQNNEDRKDLVQEIILQLWKAFDNYDDRFKHTTWMYQISLNVAISFYRKERSRKRMSNAFESEMFQFLNTEIHDEKEANLRLLNQIISGLSDLNKALILLYLEEKTHTEIAHIMGITETNVATKINRIKIKLRAEFKKQSAI